MHSLIAPALLALTALAGTASAQYCGQPVRPAYGQVFTSEFGSNVELGNDWAHFRDVSPPSSAVPGAGTLNLYSRAPVQGAQVGGHLLFESQLVAVDGQTDDGFGLTSDRSVGTLVVGAPGHDGVGVDSGAVYLFEQSGGDWVQTLKITGPTGGSSADEFGKHVAIHRDWMVISAPGRNEIYVYRKTAGVWSLYQTARPGNSQQAGLVAVDFAGGTLAVCGRNSGAVFEFDVAGQTWTQTHSFATGQAFAFTGMDLAEDRLVVARSYGVVDVYDRNTQTGGWSPSSLSATDPSGVAVVGERILVASHAASGDSVLIFSRSGGGLAWSLAGSISGSLASGDPLATDGESILVALPVIDFSSAPTLYDLDCASIGTSSCVQHELNSTGFPGLVHAVGSDVVMDNNVTLRASVLPVDSFGFFIVSRTPAVSPGIPWPLCVGGMIGRFTGPGQIQSTGAAGTLQIPIDLTAIPSPTGLETAVAGDTWYFQAWYRDNPIFGGNYAFTDGVRVNLR